MPAATAQAQGYTHPSLQWISSDAPLFERRGGLKNPASAIAFSKEPYPYYLESNVLSPSGFAALKTHWPQKKSFEYNAGYHRKSLRLQFRKDWQAFSPAQQMFWRDFIAEVCPAVMRESLYRFAPEIINKYGEACTTAQLLNFEIVELFDEQLPIHVHSHHFHSPLWLGTAVYYVDDDGETRRGTTVYRAKAGHDSIEQLVALQQAHRALDESSHIERYATVDFVPNQAFVMHDCPIGWHKVEDNRALAATGPRRHILFNWGLPFAEIQRYYGVSLEEYNNIHEEHPNDPRLRQWLERDISYVRTPCPVPAAEQLERMRRVTLEGIGALDLF